MTLARSTDTTKARYNRIAPLYDVMEWPLERLAFGRWRRRLWVQVEGPRVLEIGVGTGKNFAYYPPDIQVTAIDISERMLARARKRAVRLGLSVRLRLMDAQALDFAAGSFDTVVASFVFCSVPDPIAGLREAARVCRPQGRIVLLEHVRGQELLGLLMDAINPIVVRFSGANINRRTVTNVAKAGLAIERVESFAFGIVKLIVAWPAWG